jgi:hypothetical protein
MVVVNDRAAARAARTALATRLATEPGVVGIGLARREADYVVKVALADASAAVRVPQDVDGVRVVTEVVGAVRPLRGRTPRLPAPGGR